MKLWNLVSVSIFLGTTLISGQIAWAQSPDVIAAMKHLQSGKVDTAIQMSDSSCERGDMTSCSLSGMIHSDPKFGKQDLKFARKRFKEACDGGYVEGCVLYAQMQYTGTGGELDKQSAYKLAKRACESGSAKGCATAKHIEPEVKAATPKPAPHTPAVQAFDWSSYAPLLDQFESDLKKACTIPAGAANTVLSAVMTDCKATSGRATDLAFKTDKKALKEIKAINNFFGAMGIVEDSHLVQNVIVSGKLPKDKMFIACTGYDTADYFMGASSLLKDTEFSKRYTTLEARIVAGKSLCK